ncbi:MAG: hypothetical protein LC642_06585, partial [Verrucomicrobiaceae bacterium]|nr:hypothetical protein [Verrucomicrobiaceae bacterium]
MASTVNPFATIIASNAAGISWTVGLNGRVLMWIVATSISIAYILRYARKVRVNPALASAAPAILPEVSPAPALAPHTRLTPQMGLLLAVFILSFVVMIYGVSRLGWWFPEMTTLFFAAALLLGIIHRPGERVFVETFVAGASELLGVGLIIGLARGATIILDRGEASGTILQYASSQVAQIPGAPFIIALLFVYIVLALFIQSSSGMAVLTMPIMSALADIAGVPREQIINAYAWGLGLMGFVAPVGLVLPSLAMVGIRYDTWLRFIWPLVAILTGVSILFLAIGVML